MGVQGLLTTCLQRRDECTEEADLIEVARQQDGIELLVDFYSFEHQILYKFWFALCQLRGNEYLRILGGEYESLNKYLTKFIEDLKSVGISLVFYCDGAKGTSTEALRQKLDTWIKRHEQDIVRMNEILGVCQGQTNISNLPLETSIRPVLLEDQFRMTLKNCGCEFNQSVAGEADMLLAQALKDRPKSYAILSNDSDFCIIKDSRFIPFQLFDLENDLQLDAPAEEPEKPLRLKVRVIFMEKVVTMLKLPNHFQLIEVSIVAGNDFTGPFMTDLYPQLDIRGRKAVGNIAGWMRHYKNVQNHPVLGNEMQRNPAFRAAVHHSRKFYNLEGEPEKPPQKGYFSKVIAEGIKSGKYPSNIMSMHNNFYWYRMLLEDNGYGQPCAECAYTELRAFIYWIVLPQHEQLVEEYGRSPYENLRKAGIMSYGEGIIPRISSIKEGDVFRNLRLFHNVLSHMEIEYDDTWINRKSWFNRYGRKTGFICYLLRYFLQLNWRRNLHLTDNEYLALAAMVFGRPDAHFFQRLAIRPTPRCVTIGNWFQDLYRYAYSFLGSLLFLQHEFPPPSEIFCGSAWTAFYMCCCDQNFYMALKDVSQDNLRETQFQMNNIIKEKRHMIKYIVEGFFPFDDR